MKTINVYYVEFKEEDDLGEMNIVADSPETAIRMAQSWFQETYQYRAKVVALKTIAHNAIYE